MKTTKPSISAAANEWLLPFNRSFVIQIEAHADITAKRFSGRVEHMKSGRATHFHSQDELFGFFECNLKDRISDVRQESLESSDTEDRFHDQHS